MRVVAVGECTRDRYLDSGLEMVGGISLNFAINARRSGADEAALVSCTGAGGVDDADVGAAHAIRRKLAAEGVDASHVHSMAGATASQAIRLTHGGERIFPPNGYDPGVLATFQLDEDDLAFITTFDVVMAPYFRQVEHLFHSAMRSAASVKRVADLLDGADLGTTLAGLDPLLDTLDLAFISGGERTVDLLLPRSRQSRTLIVVTHGAGGSTALSGGVRQFRRAVPVPIDERVDTTGCGDAFQAAFTVEYFRHGDIARSLRAGAARAAGVIRHFGATGA